MDIQQNNKVSGLNVGNRHNIKWKSTDIADLIPDIIAEVDENKRYTWLNKAGLDFFGSEAIGKEAASFFEGNQETYAKVEPIFKDKEESYYLESWQRRVDGKKRLLAWWGRSLKDESGKVVGVLSTGRDITKQKLDEEKLRESEAQMYNAMKLGRLGPWVYDVKRNLFTFNDLFYEMLRTNVGEMGGYEIAPEVYVKKFLHPDDTELVAIETKKALETEDPNYTNTLDHRIYYADGELGYLTVRIFITKDQNGKTVKSYGINQDITERKKNEEELKSIKTRLEKTVAELEKINKVLVGREVKMVELKSKIKDLEQKLTEKTV